MFSALRTPAARRLPLQRISGVRTNVSYTEAKASGAAPLPYAQSATQHDDHHHHDDHHAAPAAPVEADGFHKGYFVTIAAFLTGLAVYKYHSNSGLEDTWLQQIIAKYHSRREDWEARNALHTDLIQQAATEKTLFYDQPRKTVVHLKFPQTFNMGSPHNVETGWAHGDLEAVHDYYWKQKNDYVPRVMREKKQE